MNSDGRANFELARYSNDTNFPGATDFSGATSYVWSPDGSKILQDSNKKKNFNIIL